MTITHSFIRAISGLSEAELPDSVIDDLDLISYTEEWLAGYDVSTVPATVQKYAMGYKAIVMLESYILLAVPEKIKDNFNELTRFDTLRELIQLAKDKVAEIENPTDINVSVSRFSIVTPDVDPVTQDAR